METRHLGVDRVSLTGVSRELDIPEERVVRCKGQRGAEEERGELPHGGRRSRTDNTNRAPWGLYNRGVGQTCAGEKGQLGGHKSV